MAKVILFVYGTLKRGDCRHNVLGGARFIGEARTTPGYSLFSCGPFPAMVARMSEEGVAGVQGELYEVDESLLDRTLDRIEGVPYLYDRGTVEIAEGAAPTAVSYIYQKPVTGLPPVPDGVWKVGR